MKQLTLIRHAKSSWKNPDVDDLDRPLAGRGKRQAPEMGRRLADSGFAPDLMFSSPAKRARKTAKHLLRAFERPDLAVDDRLYMASAEELLAFVRALDDKNAVVAIVGHNPGLTEFCEMLSGAGISNIPTMGVVHLDLAVERWADTKEGCAKLAGFELPKKEENVEPVGVD